MMVATILVILAVGAFGITCAYLGYTEGFDQGFETAIDFLDKEMKRCTKQH